MRSVPRWDLNGSGGGSGEAPRSSLALGPARGGHGARLILSPEPARPSKRAAKRRRRQAESFARPRRRRAFKMAWPARVDMRCRKPCFRARLRLFGWNVRFILLSSSVLGAVRGSQRRSHRSRGADRCARRNTSPGSRLRGRARPGVVKDDRTVPAARQEIQTGGGCRPLGAGHLEQAISARPAVGAVAILREDRSDQEKEQTVGSAKVLRHRRVRRSTMPNSRGFARRPHLWIPVWRTSRPECPSW